MADDTDWPQIVALNDALLSEQPGPAVVVATIDPAPRSRRQAREVYRAFLEPDAEARLACYLGWQESLRKLARLVEPEVAD